MPYIKQYERDLFDDVVDEIAEQLEGAPAGQINYVISRIIWNVFDKSRSYTTGNDLMGVLDCVKMEFYRRKLAPYEDEKIKENEDL